MRAFIISYDCFERRGYMALLGGAFFAEVLESVVKSPVAIGESLVMSVLPPKLEALFLMHLWDCKSSTPSVCSPRSLLSRTLR